MGLAPGVFFACKGGVKNEIGNYVSTKVDVCNSEEESHFVNKGRKL